MGTTVVPGPDALSSRISPPSRPPSLGTGEVCCPLFDVRTGGHSCVAGVRGQNKRGLHPPGTYLSGHTHPGSQPPCVRKPRPPAVVPGTASTSPQHTWAGDAADAGSCALESGGMHMGSVSRGTSPLPDATGDTHLSGLCPCAHRVVRGLLSSTVSGHHGLQEKSESLLILMLVLDPATSLPPCWCWALQCTERAGVPMTCLARDLAPPADTCLIQGVKLYL